jgi:DNA-binding IclR family transcriptional regulator
VTEARILGFVGKAFNSIWPLELLLVLCQENRDRWQVKALIRELRANTEVVTQGLEALTTAGFVAVDSDQGYRLEPASPDMDDMARALADLYKRKPRAVMRAIFSAPKDRIQTFADAFRMRKDTC